MSKSVLQGPSWLPGRHKFDFKFGEMGQSDLTADLRSSTYLQPFITISNELLVQRNRILEDRRILRDLKRVGKLSVWLGTKGELTFFILGLRLV